MRIVRYSRNEAIRYGIIDEKEVVELAGDPMFTGFETTGERIPLAEITLLAPSIPRSKMSQARWGRLHGGFSAK